MTASETKTETKAEHTTEAQRNAAKVAERTLAGYPPEAHGDEHYFYDVPWRI